MSISSDEFQPTFSNRNYERSFDNIQTFIRAHFATSLRLSLSIHPPQLDASFGDELQDFTLYALTRPQLYHDPWCPYEFLCLLLIPTAWPTEDLSALKDAIGSRATSSSVCGKVWKSDQLAYKCKTCERDPTCVICVECFREGDHEGHDYAMVHTSGGCCDCGDVQAWRKSGFCKKHAGAHPEEDDPSRDIDKITKQRIRDISQAVTWYLADRLMSIRAPCARSDKVAIEENCITLIEWIMGVVQCGDGMRRWVGKALTEGEGWGCAARKTRRSVDWDPQKVGIVRIIMEMDGLNHLPRKVTEKLHELWFELCRDVVFKKRFFQITVDNYKRYIHATAMQHFQLMLRRKDDHDLPPNIIEIFSVQLFTVPAHVELMIEEGGLLDILLDILTNAFECCSSQVGPYEESMPFSLSAFQGSYRNAQNSKRAKMQQASSSNADFIKQTRRYHLPLPFSLPELTDVFPWTNGDELQREHVESWNQRVRPHAQHSRGTFTEETTAEQIGVYPGENRFKNDSGSSVNDSLNAVDKLETSVTRLMSLLQAESAQPTPEIPFVHMDVDTGILGPDGLVVGDDVLDLQESDEGLSDDERVVIEESSTSNTEMRRNQELFEEADLFEDGLKMQPSKAASIQFQRVKDMDRLRARFSNERRTSWKPEPQMPRRRAGRPRLNPGKLKDYRDDVIESRNWGPVALAGKGPLCHTLRLDASKMTDKLTVRVLSKVIYDLKYVLGHKAVAYHIVHVRRRLFKKFVRALSMAQGMNFVSRNVGNHVDVESDGSYWGYKIETYLFHCVKLMREAFCDTGKNESDGVMLAKSRLECIHIVRSCLDEWLEREEAMEARSVIEGESFSAAHSISIHIPLHRLLAHMAHQVVKLDNADVATALRGRSPETSEDALMLVRHPLRIASFLTQLRARMWVRNGTSITYQHNFYYEHRSSEWFLDLDLFLLQACTIVIGAQRFISEALLAYRISDLRACLNQLKNPSLLHESQARGSTHMTLGSLGVHPFASLISALTTAKDRGERLISGNLLHDLQSFVPSFIRGFFVLLTRVASDRTKIGWEDSEVLRRKVLHHLCSADRSYSKLCTICSMEVFDELFTNDEDDERKSDNFTALLNNTLAEISVYIEPKRMSQGKYRLKDEFWDEFDRFEPHLHSSDRHAALIRFANICKKDGKPHLVIPAVDVNRRPLYPAFRTLHNLCFVAAKKFGIVSILLTSLLSDRGTIRTLDDTIPAALHIAKLSAEETIRVGSLDYDESHGDHPLKDTGIGTVFNTYCKQRRLSDSPWSHLFPTMEAIIQDAYMKEPSFIRKFISNFPKAENFLYVCEPQKLGYGGEFMKAQDILSKEAKRREIQRKKKELQKAAMAKMRQEQAKFARFMESGEDATNGIVGSSAKNKDAPTQATQFADLSKNASQKPHSDQATSPAQSLVTSIDYECALCHGAVDDETNLLGLIGFKQDTAIPSLAEKKCQFNGNIPIQEVQTERLRSSIRAHKEPSMSVGNAMLSNLREDSFLLDPGKLCNGVESGASRHISFCGHALHLKCFEGYFAILKDTRDHHHMFEGHRVVDLDKYEFLCPVCRRVANIVFPIMQKATLSIQVRNQPRPGIFASGEQHDGWLRSLHGDIGMWSERAKKEVCRSLEQSKRRGDGSSIDLRKQMVRHSEVMLRNFQLLSSKSGSTTMSRLQLSAMTMTTIACAEVASRAVEWQDRSTSSSRRSLTLLFAEARNLISAYPVQRFHEICELWKKLQSSEACYSLDPFACIVSLLVLWPDPLLPYEVRHLVQLCFNLHLEKLRHNSRTSNEYYQTMVFLRRTCILISSANVESPDLHLPVLENSEFEVDTKGLNSLFKYLNLTIPLTQNFSQSVLSSSSVSHWPKRVGLLELPSLYETILEQTDEKCCIYCGKSSPPKALCLISGAVVCTDPSCDRHPLRRHAAKCGKGVGIFLIIRQTVVQVLRDSRSSYWGSPYLDAHGEEDQQFRRGKPLHLCKPRYAELERMFLLHSFDQDSRLLSLTHPNGDGFFP